MLDRGSVRNKPLFGRSVAQWVGRCWETFSALPNTAKMCVLVPWLEVGIKAAIFISKTTAEVYNMDLIIELAITGTAHTRVCFFDMCRSHVSTVASQKLTKPFVCVSLKQPARRGELHCTD